MDDGEKGVRVSGGRCFIGVGGRRVRVGKSKIQITTVASLGACSFECSEAATSNCAFFACALVTDCDWIRGDVRRGFPQILIRLLIGREPKPL